jgi:hypothetical protein
MQNSIGRDAYDEMVARVGKQEADRQVRQYGWEITPTSEEQSADYGLKAIPASQVSNLLGEGGLSLAMGGGDNMEDDDLADEGVASSAPSDDDLVNAYSSLGPLSAMDLSDPNKVSQAIINNAAEQKRYYDELSQKIRERRYGPSETEKLLALSSAFFAPTSVRGFSGTMSNVLPVLQKFGELKRTGEQERTEALQGLAKQRMALAQGDIKNALLLQKMQADYLQAGKPKYRLGQDNAFYVEPGTGGYPEMPGMDAYGNYVITDRRQLNYLPVNTRVVEPGQDPTKPNYVPERGKGE